MHIDEFSFSASLITLLYSVSTATLCSTIDIAAFSEYCLMAEIQGVFLPELQSEAADGLVIPFTVFI